MTLVIVPVRRRIMQHVIIRCVSDASPRERMIQSAMLLVGERGVEATSFSEVIEHSGAPRGSIYHHFPGGKAQLMEEATRWGGELISAGLRQALEHADPVAAVDGIAGFWRAALRDTNYAGGCPVGAATVEGVSSPGPVGAAGGECAGWAGRGAAGGRGGGVGEGCVRVVVRLVVVLGGSGVVL